MSGPHFDQDRLVIKDDDYSTIKTVAKVAALAAAVIAVLLVMKAIMV